MLLALAVLLGGCRTVSLPAPLPPVRFLLTFDDGPSQEADDNSTARILATLASNPLQPGIKAVFFVQSGWVGPGPREVALGLVARAAAEGHVLGLHGSGVHGHREHTALTGAELAGALASGVADVLSVGAAVPTLVRPPSWRHGEATLRAYQREHLTMLLTDVSAFDGALVQFQVDPDGGERIDRDLRCLRERLARGTVAPLDGVLPVVATFHDPNPYTARHLARYLAALVRSARAAGFPVADPPFYASAPEADRAAHARAASTHGWTNAFMRRCPD